MTIFSNVPSTLHTSKADLTCCLTCHNLHISVRIMCDIIGPNLDITAFVTVKQVMTEFVYVFVLWGAVRNGEALSQHKD